VADEKIIVNEDDILTDVEADSEITDTLQLTIKHI